MLELFLGLKTAVEGGDGLAIASSVLGLVATVGSFFPPIGTAVAALAGVAQAIMGLFGASPGPSDLQIMGEMIEDQTKQISGKIDAQTDILLAAIQASVDKIDSQTLQLTNEIRGATKELRIEFFYQMIDDMQVKMLIIYDLTIFSHE